MGPASEANILISTRQLHLKGASIRSSLQAGTSVGGCWWSLNTTTDSYNSRSGASQFGARHRGRQDVIDEYTDSYASRQTKCIHMSWEAHIEDRGEGLCIGAKLCKYCGSSVSNCLIRILTMTTSLLVQVEKRPTPAGRLRAPCQERSTAS